MKLLVAYDGSESSKNALQEGINMVKARGGEVLLYTAIEVVDYFDPLPLGEATLIARKLPPEEVKERVQKAGDKVQEEAKKELKKAEVAFRTQIDYGSPRADICEVAEKEGTDMIVVGSRGLGTIKRMFLGSVSQYVVNHAPCSVLVVRPPKM